MKLTMIWEVITMIILVVVGIVIAAIFLSSKKR